MPLCGSGAALAKHSVEHALCGGHLGSTGAIGQHHVVEAKRRPRCQVKVTCGVRDCLSQGNHVLCCGRQAVKVLHDGVDGFVSLVGAVAKRLHDAGEILDSVKASDTNRQAIHDGAASLCGKVAKRRADCAALEHVKESARELAAAFGAKPSKLAVDLARKALHAGHDGDVVAAQFSHSFTSLDVDAKD